MANKLIADMLEEIASMLSLEEAPNSKFEVRAYQKAAFTVATTQEDMEDIYRKSGLKGLMELPGIGKSIAGSIEEYIKTGRIKKYGLLKRKYPVDMRGLTGIEGLGPKKVLALYKELGVKDITSLKKALAKHKIADLPGFGPRSEEAIQKGITMLEGSRGRMLLGDALPVAEAIIKKLQSSGLVEKAMIAGSARRMRETVGDLDILALSDKSREVMDFFSEIPEASSIIVKGPTKTSVVLKIGINCDLRVLSPDSFGAALQYFTGSKDHNVEVRTLAISKGYKLNEYGIFDRKGRLIPTKDEEGIYGRLGMQCMPPEMREARGEVRLALEHKIPVLVELRDIRGDMHTHTKDSDGANSIDEMADAAMGSRLDYFATTNHTKSLGVARGMDENGFARYFKRVDRLNSSLDGKIRILKGAEVDILKDGSLDLSDASLKSMDCVVASVHSNFRLAGQEMTNRIVKALDSGLVNILGHPTGRQINTREQYPLDLDKVFEAAERNGVALEIDSEPLRLDLNDTNIMRASRYKVRFSIDSDAHSASQFSFLKYGIGTARRGWLTKGRVINTLPLDGIMKVLSN